jgi:hypothetical protein
MGVLRMYRQTELPLEIAQREPTPGGSSRHGRTLDARFEEFHASHPWVLEALEELTAKWLAAGGGCIGVKALFEQLRWSPPGAMPGELFRLNNDFTSRYARLLCARHPEWVAVFQLRTLRTVDSDSDRDSE